MRARRARSAPRIPTIATTLTSAVLATALVACPARAAEWPSPQAQLAHAEFLSTDPAPAGGAAAVCVVDTGVDLTTDVAPAVVGRLAVDGGTGDDLGGRADLDQPKHGTYVAGAIASQIDGRGSSGIWPAAKIVSVRVFPGHGGGVQANDYIRGINLCELSPAPVRVINISLGGFGADDPNLANLANRITQARAQYGINVVAGVGNEGGSVAYPAALAGAFGVGASRPDGALCSFSNRGTGLDLSATGCGPGGTEAFNELTYLDGGLARSWGTSYATPIVSAVLAALRSHDPTLTPAAAEASVIDTASGGVLDVTAAFRRAGLGAVVDAYQPPPAPLSAGGGGGGAAVESTATPKTDPVDPPMATPVEPTVERELSVMASTTPPVTKIRLLPSRPALTRLRFTRGLLDVAVGRPLAGRTVVFRIDGRPFRRPDGHLRARVARWRRLSVTVVTADGRASPALAIDHHDL